MMKVFLRAPRLGDLAPGLCLALATLPTGALASDDALFFSEMPMVATVSRLPQRQSDAPAAVTVLDRDVIRASGARELSDVLRLVPGFQTFADNTDSSRVTYHGMTDREESSRVQVMVDGRSLFSPLFGGGINWRLVPVALEDIERIEIIRGSNSTAQGANAFQGVINIVTVAPELTRGFMLGASHGNQGVRDYTVRQGGQLGESGSYRFRYQQKDDSGLTDRFNWQDYHRSRLFDWRSDFTIGNRDSLHLSFGRTESDSLKGRSTDASNPIHQLSESSTYLQAAWLHSVAAESDVQLRYAYAEDVATERYSGVSAPFVFAVGNEDGISRRHELELQHRFVLSPSARAVWGGSYRRDTLYFPQFLYAAKEAERTVSRVFGNLEWKTARWLTTNFGTAWEDDSLAGQLPSYRASANFHLNEENTLRFGVARASRSASILNYRGDGRLVASNVAGVVARLNLGNEQLGSERLDTLEVGYLADWKAQRMSLDVRLFREHLPNRWYDFGRFLVQYCGGMFSGQWCPKPITQMEALQDVHTRGIEYQWRWQPVDATRLMLSQTFMSISSNYLPGVTSGAVNQLLAPGQQLNTNLDQLTERSAPRRSTALLWMQKLPRELEFSMSGVIVSDMKWTVNTSQQAYRRVDARLAQPFRLAGRRGEIALTVQSLNGAHGEFSADNSADDRVVERRSWLSLSFEM